MKKVKALVLFSGGLDSIIAAKTLQEQGIEVTALAFVSYFFDSRQAELSAKENNIPLRIENFSQEHLEVVKAPKRGYGNAMNPCIDCHRLMLSMAKKIMAQDGYDLLATGEVLGQRPFSQNRQALGVIEKDAGLKKAILRPLSAKLLEPTSYEEQGLVEREKLHAISGKSRKHQLELAGKYSIKVFPSPAGGCRLTEKQFTAKLQKLFTLTPDTEAHDFQLIRFGRHFWIEEKSRWHHIVLGKNKEENCQIDNLAGDGDTVIKRVDQKGPTAIIRKSSDAGDEILEKTKELICEYSKTRPGDRGRVQFTIKKTGDI